LICIQYSKVKLCRFWFSSIHYFSWCSYNLLYVLGMQAKHAEIKKTAFEFSRSRPLLSSQRKIFMNSKNFFSTVHSNFNCKVPKERKVSFFTIGSHFACKIVCKKSDYQFDCKDRHIISGLAKITLDILSVNMLCWQAWNIFSPHLMDYLCSHE